MFCQMVFVDETIIAFFLFSAGLVAVGSGMPFPCLRSFLSKQVESSELGITVQLILTLSFSSPTVKCIKLLT